MALIEIRPSLRKRAHPLAPADAQRARLAALPLGRPFDEAIRAADPGGLRRGAVRILQINVGKRCNQTCRHCHVDAGPDRQEVMPDDVVDAALGLLARSSVETLDITGGAPELHPRFREIVTRARGLGRHVIDRCNLTILTLPNYADLGEFLASQRVEIVASLPWYAPQQTDAQRGRGVFEASIAALRRLNDIGYGREGSGLVLTLVTNPAGAFLPANQRALERDWRRELARRYGITFDHLYTITNMPVSRYLEYLEESGNLERYMERLVAAFNPGAVEGLMCRGTLSVGWDGRLYDCDFNQMLELPLAERIQDVRLEALEDRPVRVGAHCYGCTAGLGSSCGGVTAKTEEDRTDGG
jgi:radical SAM/Cys-rich protein